MANDLYSPHWYRIAELHPKLRAHVHMQRQNMRGQPWYLLSDPSEGRHFRLNASAYRFVGLCDGQRTVQSIWDTLTDTLGDAAPTQGEVVSILGRLADAGMLQTEVVPDVEAMFEGQAKREQKKTLAQLNPLSLRVSLLDPTAILQRFQPWLGAIFNRWTLLIWVLLVGFAGAGAVMEWQGLAAEAAAVSQAPRMLLLIWLVYPLVKLTHEFGHALAVRRWGGEVAEMGITLLMLTPVPWVDATAATAFPRRYQRFVVSAAGILAELALAALAFFVWRATQPGTLHDVMLVIMLIGGVSTVLFNGNPLLRYDGYYMLCDLLGMPNLAARSTTYWGYLAKRFLLRLQPEAPVMGQGERPWLLFYGLASYLYRIFVSLLILYWLLDVSRLLFVVAALLMLWSLLVKPLRTIIAAIWRAQGSPAQRRRARWLGLSGIGAAAVFLAFVPLPHWSVAEGVVWLPEHAHVRPQTEGFVLQTHARDGEPVRPGQLLLSLEDPVLLAERDKLEGQWEALRAKQVSALQETAGDAKSLADEMASIEEQMRRNAERIEQLSVRAGVAGTLVLPRQQDLPGHFAQRGDDLGYILPAGQVQVRAVIPQQDAELARGKVQAAQVWLRESRHGVQALPRSRGMAAASRELPSAALGERGGGALATDAKDPKGLTAAEPVFVMDFDVPGTPLHRVGGRALVRLDLGREPLLMQGWRRLRQVFLVPGHAA
jgi:putative peptide zinc metalloprotease protein